MPFLTPVFGMAFLFLCSVTLLQCYIVTTLLHYVIQTTVGRKDLENTKRGCTRDFSPLAQQLVFTTLRSVLNDNMFSFF